MSGSPGTAEFCHGRIAGTRGRGSVAGRGRRTATASVRSAGSASGLLALVCILATGCSDGTTSQAPSTSSPSTVTGLSDVGAPPADPVTTGAIEPSVTLPPSTPAVEDGAEIEVLLASRVRAYFDARTLANAAPEPDPTHPALAEAAVGAELDAVVANTHRRRDAGQAIRAGDGGLAEIRVGSVDVGATSAAVAACAVDDGVIYEVTTGEVVDDAVVTHNYFISLELHDGVWKVARVVRVQQWEGVAGCALTSGDFPY